MRVLAARRRLDSKYVDPWLFQIVVPPCPKATALRPIAKVTTKGSASVGKRGFAKSPLGSPRGRSSLETFQTLPSCCAAGACFTTTSAISVLPPLLHARWTLLRRRCSLRSATTPSLCYKPGRSDKEKRHSKSLKSSEIATCARV